MLISRVVIGRNARQISRLWQALATKFPSLNNFSDLFLRLTEIVGPLFRRPLLLLLVRNIH